MEYKLAIVIVTYNRLQCFQRLLLSLERGYYDKSAIDLIISIDKSDSDEIGLYADQYHWDFGNKIVVKHPENLGLRRHILSIGRYLEEYDCIIVLEDDVTVTPNFVRYTKCCVKKYQNDKRIAGISLYSFPLNQHNRLPFYPVKSKYDVFFMNYAQSWGQVWMRNQWNDFYNWYKTHQEDFSNRKDLPYSISHWPKNSWLKYHTRYCIEQNKYFVYPYYALSTNNGDPGIHAGGKSVLFQSYLMGMSQQEYLLPSLDDIDIVKYDGFFEPKFLHNYFGLTEDDLCVDIFGLKPECLYKKYLLSTKILPYKIVKGYDLALRPIEMNILWDIPGKGIFLFDTNIPANNNINNKLSLYTSIYRFSIENAFHMIGIKMIIKRYLQLKYMRFKKWTKRIIFK